MSDLSVEFKKVLDAHGYGFQYAVLNECERLRQTGKSPWSFEAAEFPVMVAERETRIDLLLRTHSAVLVGECKRANPAIARWCFARAPQVARRASAKDVRLDQFSREETTGRFRTRPFELTGVSDQYQIAIEMRTTAQGEAEIRGRGAIDEAITQVVRGSNGLINAIAANPGIMNASAMFVVPVVFTTAELWCSDVNLSLSDMATGKTQAGQMKAHPWIWFQQNVSPSLEHSHQKVYGEYPLSSIAQTLRFRHARSIAIVTPSGMQEFLEGIQHDFEDFHLASITPQG